MNEQEIRQRWGSFYAERVRRRNDLTKSYVDFVVALNARGLPPIFENHHLSLLMNIRPSSIANMTNNIDAHYRSFTIPKRRGGVRIIDVPAPILLDAQRWIDKTILSTVALSEHCHSYRVGRSVITNALPHLSAKNILKIDLQDFFPTISKSRIDVFFQSLGYPGKVAETLSTICCKDGHLPQGAATSPALSNIVAAELDIAIAVAASAFRLNYTRYADDLTFSGEAINQRIIQVITKLALDNGFIVNRSNTQVICGKRKKIVTGISVGGAEVRLPRETRREIEKQAYYVSRFGLMEHCLTTDQLDPIYIDRLYSRIGFWLQVEPNNATAINCQKIVKAAIEELD